MIQVVPQLFIDPETGIFDADRFRKALPVGGDEAVGDGSDLDIAEALREETMYQGWDGQEETAIMLPAPKPWQNHSVRLRQHGQLLKSASFEKWLPINREAFMRHYLATSIEVENEMIRRMEMMAAASGGGGANDSGSQPRSLPPSSQGMPPMQGPSMHASETTSVPAGSSMPSETGM